MPTAGAKTPRADAVEADAIDLDFDLAEPEEAPDDTAMIAAKATAADVDAADEAEAAAEGDLDRADAAENDTPATEESEESVVEATVGTGKKSSPENAVPAALSWSTKPATTTARSTSPAGHPPRPRGRSPSPLLDLEPEEAEGRHRSGCPSPPPNCAKP
jgi:hypothetical protein